MPGWWNADTLASEASAEICVRVRISPPAGFITREWWNGRHIRLRGVR